MLFFRIYLQTMTTQRTMPTLAAVPAQRATKPTTKRPAKRPNAVNEAPATVRQPDQLDHTVKITNLPSNVEYTFYTYHVNINQLIEFSNCMPILLP